MPDFSAKMHQIQFPPSTPIPWLQYGVAVWSGNDQSLCFSLRLCFSNHVCSTPNYWRTRNQRHGFMAGRHWQKKLLPIYLYCLNCTKFGQLILQKIIKIVATRCHILRLKFTKFDFGWGSAPDPAGGAYSAPPDPLAAFKGPTSKGREGKGGKGGKGKEREGEGEGTGRGKGGEGEKRKGGDG